MCRAILFLTFKIIPLKGIILISERYNYTFKRYNRKVKKKPMETDPGLKNKIRLYKKYSSHQAA